MSNHLTDRGRHPMSQTPAYADLEIRILPRGDAGYPIQMTLNEERLAWGPCLMPEAGGRDPQPACALRQASYSAHASSFNG